MMVNDAPIVVDPVHPKLLLLGSNDFNCPNQESALGFHISSDGGSQWNNICMLAVSIDGVEYITGRGPIVGYDRNGVAYIGGPYVSNNEQVHAAFEAFSKSSDGISWTTPAPSVSRTNWAPVYCWMAVDTNSESPYLNSVYIPCVLEGPLNDEYMSQVVIARSSDGGATWQQSNVAPVQNAPNGQANVNMTIGRDGSLYLTWLFCNSRPVCEASKLYMFFSASHDGGNSWTPPAKIATVTSAPNGYIPNTSVFVTNIPAITVDNSNGPRAGNLYVVMYNWTGAFIQVEVVHSTDGGNTWSIPVAVAPGFTHDQFFPWISVSAGGVVSASWLDRRNDPNNIEYQAFAGFSIDGAISFQPSVQLTPNFSNPNNDPIGWMGDYTGNTWDGPNYFVAGWMDNSQTTYMQDVVGGVRLK